MFRQIFTVVITRELTNSPWHLYQTYFVVSLHIDDFTFIAHAYKRQSESLQRRKNVSATSSCAGNSRLGRSENVLRHDLHGCQSVHVSLRRAVTTIVRLVDCAVTTVDFKTFAYLLSYSVHSYELNVREGDP